MVVKKPIVVHVKCVLTYPNLAAQVEKEKVFAKKMLTLRNTHLSCYSKWIFIDPQSAEPQHSYSTQLVK